MWWKCGARDEARGLAANMTGRLVLVATPIGNLGDITARAIETLQQSDVICCEDTRHSQKLFQRFGIGIKRLIVVNDHTEHDVREEIVALIAAGKTVALITDAGSPGISDPGERLVRAAIDAGLAVSAAPGPSAAVMAISLSGLASSRWVFEGFLPRSGAERSERLEAVAAELRTVVLYEAPHRLHRTLTDLESMCGAYRRVVIAAELTKIHEHLWRGTLHDAVRQFAGDDARGEFVIVVDGAAPAAPPTDDEIITALRAEIAAGASRKDAASRVSARLGVAKRHVYELTLSLG
ncbi:MAG: 16S rRNA (cytidine(1402)-2'-O)-methyltransferase [Actinobacteria bacterium]|jgi:16S rRNA (cytidine1402-2'-O)-methyltransferase|nr:16S rRNA (cytidine(1402)-2'-O)-methyltransferase [Actinomycetota bacterium]NCV97360.1 16S rRNA (cytidine(1402)-2'-O)-methyltransferase [Acidimicrobiia bacterium]NCX17934.1 16S rRNA (cytidine(1402)-2'-O)-methyltransferase [Acidimicrobiia bacterium]NCZ67283.1 16S rRNA (cytidine(1402)-2'-O)-methyltransferase [Acidimicrobiia bacterium]NCZ88783.1 16S rRNA (cytidine(1402)-2'-O)-methyltransferase [Actinomycetota bacterium]